MLSLGETELTRTGIPGDRAFYLVDERRRMVNAKRFGALLTIRPEHDVVGNRLALHFPDGSTCEGEIETGEPAAVTFFGQQVQARPVAGPFSDAISDFVGHSLRLMARPETHPAVDRGAVAGATLLGASSVKRLEEVARNRGGAGPGQITGADIDHRRFRMSIEFEGFEAHAEDDWVGRGVRVGEARIRVNGHVGRCAVTTRDPENGERDLPVLGLLKSYRDTVVSEEALPFGVFASVREPGRVRVGDPVEPA